MINIKLHNYQIEGLNFLLQHRGGLLLDEQGLGKTIQALYCIRESLSPGLSTCTNLEALIIVCPAIMQATWKHHVKQILGDLHIKILIHSYEWYSKEEHLKEVIKKINKSYQNIAIIVDEAHYIKTPTSKRTQSVFALLKLPQVSFKILLTGTPITRDIDDLYIPLKIFYPNFCKSIYEFRKRFMNCIRTFFGETYKGYRSDGAKEYIIAMLQRISLRRTKRTAGINLPPIVRTPVYIDINKEIAKESLKLLDYATKIINGSNYDTYKTNLEAEANHIASIRKALGIAKVPQTLAYIQTVVDANIDKLVIFGVHIDVVNLIVESLSKKYKDYTIHKITGATTQKQRNTIIDMFQNNDKKQILVANMVACGVGVTLTKASTVVFAELDFTPSNIMQAEARVHRITQNNSVNSIFLLANDSIDVKIIGLIKSKIEIIKGTLL